MTHKQTAASSRDQKIRRDSARINGNRTAYQKSENVKRMSTNKYKACLDGRSRNVNPELKVKDFSSYYLSGPRGCFDAKYSVTSHAAPCFAHDLENCSPTCSYQHNVQLNYNCRPGYTGQKFSSKRKLPGDAHKHTHPDATKDHLKLCRQSSCSITRDTSLPRFKGAYTGRCYYEAYQVSKTDLTQKKGVKFFNDERREEVSRTSLKKISRDEIYRPMHLIEEASSCYSKKIEYRKPIPSYSIRSLDDAKKPKLSVSDNGRAGRVKNYRRILYNEGIDDDLVGRHSVSQHRPLSPSLASKKSSKDWTSDDVIPCSYVNRSKYHNHCQEEVSKKCYKHDTNDRVDVTERSRGSSAEEIPVILYRAPSIKLPRKILACIRSIDGKTIL